MIADDTFLPPLDLLKENLFAAEKVAQRLLWSKSRVEHLMPLDADKVDALSEEDEERLDAFLLRFNSLTAMVARPHHACNPPLGRGRSQRSLQKGSATSNGEVGRA